MSRPFLIGILAIMLGLLGVMSFYVKADPKKEQEKQQMAAAEAQKKASDEETKKKQQGMIQDQAKQTMQAIASKIKQEKTMPVDDKRQGPSKMVTVPPIKRGEYNPNDDMSWDWAKRRKPGEAGMKEVLKDAEERKKNAPPPATMTQGASAQPSAPGAVVEPHKD